MANLSNIILPDATSVILKDNSQSKSDHRHDSTNIVPIVHKLYEDTSYYGTGASVNACTWYMFSIIPDAWYRPWSIKVRFHSYCPGYPAYDSMTDALITGRSTGVSYANWNETSTTAHYYTCIYPLTKAGFDAGYGHAVGICIYGSGDYNKAAYYRSFEVDYLESENCTVTVLDTPVKWANWPGTGTTNYGTVVTPDAHTRGLQETSDNNTVTENRISYFACKTGVRGVWAGSLFMEDGRGRFQNICMGTDATETSLGTRTVNATKLPNSNGFKVGSSIWYTTTTYAANTNISGASVIYSSISLFDSRYSLNTTLVANSLTPYSLLYLVGTINPEDNLYYLDDIWWTQTPNDPNKVYVLVGSCFDSTTSYCRITLYEQNKWYRYDGTSLVEFTYGATTLVSKGSMVPIIDTEPYLYRQSGGNKNSIIGAQETDTLIGASAVVNQMVQNGNFTDTSGWKSNTQYGTISVENNIMTQSFTATPSQSYQSGILTVNIDYIKDHKYLLSFDFKPSINCMVRFYSAPTNYTTSKSVSANVWDKYATIMLSSQSLATSTSLSNISDARLLSAGDTLSWKNFMLIDLTAMFGTAIADYIYSLEQATAGSGIAYLRKYGFFTKGYIPYTANALQSVNTSKHVTVGFNQWDEEWLNGYISSIDGSLKGDENSICSKNYMPCFPSVLYYSRWNTTATPYICWYDENIKFITRNTAKNTALTAPSNARYFKISCYNYGTTYNNDVCINISKAGKNGTYEPYVKHEYALPNIDLRGLYKLDASNNLYADGDVLTGDGTLTRKYGIVDLGTLNWNKLPNDSIFYSTSLQDFYAIKGNNSIVYNGLCPIYFFVSRSNLHNVDKSIALNWSDVRYVSIKDSAYSDKDVFKAAMSGVYLIYELATPTTEQATGFTNPQIVDKYGTEEYTDERDFPLPVGHETVYLSELYGDREKLDSLPDRANTDGIYAISQNLGQMTLVPTSEISVGDAETVDGHTVESNVPSDAVFTDTKVTQTATTDNANYEVLFSGTADNTTRTECARKTNKLQFNPSTELLTVTKEKIAHTAYGISSGKTTGTPKETILKTGIKWVGSKHMPVVHITGYAYGLQSPVEFKIGFYIYQDVIGWCGVTNMGAWAPDVYLFKYTRDSEDYVAIGFAGQCYYLQLQVDVQDEMGAFGYIKLANANWSWEFLTTTGNIPTPDAGVTCIKVPYKANILNPSKVNGHTVATDVPSGAVFTDTTYTFADGTNGFTVTPAGGTAQTVTVTPSITNNITGSGTTNKIAKFTGANTIGDGYSVDTTVTGGSENLVTSGAVWTAIDNLPEPMVFQGSVGTDGTKTWANLPAPSATGSTKNIGHTYKAIEARTTSQTSTLTADVKIGDTIISDGTNWVVIPSGDEPSGTVTSVTLQATSPIVVDNSSAITTSGTRTFSHADSGVTIGTYKSVTVDAKGHITAGTNPTTLSGYGITDAKIANGTVTLGSNSITPLTSSSTLDASKLSGTVPSTCYTDTKNTAGSTDTSSKIYLVGATSQAANPQTYSDDEVYATSGVVTTKSVQIGGGSCTLQYNSTTQSCDFIFS